MQKHEIIGLITYLLLPLVSLLAFLWLKRKMKKEKILNSPVLPLFIIFATYGGILLLLITAYLLEWSGMASLGVFYLLFIAPILMVVIVFNMYKIKQLSFYHKGAYLAGILYFIVAPIAFIILLYTT